MVWYVYMYVCNVYPPRRSISGWAIVALFEISPCLVFLCNLTISTESTLISYHRVVSTYARAQNKSRIKTDELNLTLDEVPRGTHVPGHEFSCIPVFDECAYSARPRVCGLFAACMLDAYGRRQYIHGMTTHTQRQIDTHTSIGEIRLDRRTE